MAENEFVDLTTELSTNKDLEEGEKEESADSGMDSLNDSKNASNNASNNETPDRNLGNLDAKPADPVDGMADDEDLIAEPSAPAEREIARIEDLNDEPAEARNTAVVEEEINYDDVEPETYAERLWGLTEMFPEPIRNACSSLTDFSINFGKSAYGFSRSAAWIFFTSSMILFAPVLLETERAQMAELEMSQKQRVLLGPGAAMQGGGGAGGMPALPPMQR